MKADIEKWLERVEIGVKYKEEFGSAKNWATYRGYGRGHFPGFTGGTNGILPYNLTYAMQRGMVPEIYFKNPYFSVSPRFDPSLHLQARIIESINNLLIEEMGIKETFKLMIQDAYYTNRGIAKIGYDGLWSRYADSNEAALSRQLGIPLDQMGRGKGMERVEYNVNVKPGSPWVERTMPETIVVPFGVRSLDDCPWIDHIVIRSLEDVKRDRKYKNTEGLEGTHLEILNRDASRKGFYDELGREVTLVEVHEIRDFKRREIATFVPGYDKWLREPSEDVLQIDGLPFVDFCFNPDGEFYWGPSDVQIFEPQQLEINEARTQAMYHRRVALLKFLVESEAIDEGEIEKMLSDHVAPVVRVKGKPREIVETLQPHIPADLVQWTDVIRSDVRELMGRGRQQLGEAPPGRRTAEEMRQVQAAHDVRMDERRDIVADALVKMMRKVDQIIFDRWSMDRVAQVVGYDGARYWVNYRASELKGEYNYRVDVESMTPRTKAIKKREIVELVQALGKNPRANIDHLLRLLLHEYDYVDAMQVLPEAQETMGGPMTSQQFMQQQNGLMNDSNQLNARARETARMVRASI